ncbi:MAG TPA: glycosyltransferase family 2 protein [Candidatus Thermoplasmatota archaeon]|nr:glycosyltransferase family 2 protein [Candidatus Thermoplasmatota archaeon]
MTRVSVLLPARDEEHGLAATLREIPYAAMRRAGHELEVVVADGASRDRTRDVALAWGARVVAQPGRGKGDAVRAALPELAGDVVVMMDADRTYPAERVPDFVARVESGADLVLGSRFRGRIEPGAMSWVHRLGNHGLSLLASTLHARRVTDVCTGMWAFRREPVLALGLESSAFEIEAELFARACRAGLVVAELPIHYRPRLGRAKLGGVRDGLRIGSKLLALRVSRQPRVATPARRRVPGA